MVNNSRSKRNTDAIRCRILEACEKPVSLRGLIHLAGLSRNVAWVNEHINALLSLGFLREIKTGNRNRLFQTSECGRDLAKRLSSFLAETAAA
jgi:predicted transcriptional regulator